MPLQYRLLVRAVASRCWQGKTGECGAKSYTTGLAKVALGRPLLHHAATKHPRTQGEMRRMHQRTKMTGKYWLATVSVVSLMGCASDAHQGSPTMPPVSVPVATSTTAADAPVEAVDEKSIGTLGFTDADGKERMLLRIDGSLFRIEEGDILGKVVQNRLRNQLR